MTSAHHERFSQALYGTARAWNVALDRRLKHLGLSRASWLTIAAVARSAAKTQTELAASLGVEQPTMVPMLDRLVEQGYLMRVASASDRRVKRIVLTQRGQEMYSQLRGVVDRFLQELLCDIGKEQVEAATAFLECLHATIETKR
jgi:MarR family transcriptional regulator, transcriptional regulator for hemolysin